MYSYYKYTSMNGLSLTSWIVDRLKMPHRSTTTLNPGPGCCAAAPPDAAAAEAAAVVTASSRVNMCSRMASSFVASVTKSEETYSTSTLLFCP